MIKIIIASVIFLFVAAYRWEAYRKETMWDDSIRLWPIIKNVGLLLTISLIALLIIFYEGEVDERTLQHYEPRY